MLYWTKYKIYDCYENDTLVIFNTRISIDWDKHE